MRRAKDINPASQGAATPPLAASAMSVMGRKFGLEHARFVYFRIGSRNIKDILEDERYIWIASSCGVIRYDTATDQYMVFNNQEDGLFANNVFSMVRDSKGELWIGSFSGIAHISRK